MPFCGFNEKMLSGLTAFCEGLVEHGLVHRSELNGETVQQAIKREISDLTRILFETHRIDDSAKREMTEGIAKFATGFYMFMRKQEISDYKEAVRRLNEYFHYMDETYYSELEGSPDDMRELAKRLNDKSI